MANYLPVLLVSVTAGMPDDAALQPLPRGQVDYLSHDWAEEDVWRSWRSMTKQKNDIANGVRLENASWRTWMKQRNKLKTISPETLNWLKDSDVTWLYGPLHTAVDWTPPPKPAISPPVMQRGKDDTSAPSPKSTGANSLSSPSSTVHLDRFNPPAGRYSTPSHAQDGSNSMKPILKHRSIAEMLTSALPPAPAWAEEHAEYESDLKHQGEWMADGSEGRTPQERRESSISGKGGRPTLVHTKSDTNILPRFGHGRGGAPKKAHISPPRVAAAAEDRAPRSPSQSHLGSLSADQRTGASNNLAELAIAQAPASPYWKAATLENTESRASSTFTNDTASSGRPESDASGLCSVATLPPQKKHISFNAIVEQCIAIDGGSDPITPSTQGSEWTTYEDDGYTRSTEDGLFEDVSPHLHGDSDSDDACVDEEDEILEIKPPSRRSSSSSLQEYRAAVEAQQTDGKRDSPPIHPRRPQFRRSSTGSSRLGRSHKSTSTSAGSTSGSGSNSGRTSESGRSRSSVALDREHVSIAPIAPTILKAGETEDTEDGVLYIGSAPYSGYSASPSVAHGSSNGGLYAAYTESGYGYGYGGYGYGERVSAGRDDAYENFERGNEAGEIVYQSPNGNVYPWGDADAMRFRMQSEYCLPESSPQGYAPHSPQQSSAHQPGSAYSSIKEDDTARFIPGPLVREPTSEGTADELEFEYFDSVEGARRVEARDGERLDPNEDKRVGAGFATQRYVGAIDNADQQSPQLLDSGSLHERTPSPDFQGKINPRIASLKSESGYRSPPPAPSHGSDVTVSSAPSLPTRAIPTPRVSSAHLQDHVRMRSPPDSPNMHAGLLSPPDMSPRGRSICVSPVSGSATSSSIARSGSRSTSEERSDSRGRSRTRNSSLASSPEQGDPERGRSRSRSNNSPLSDNSSPHTRSPSYSIGGIGIGLGIGGGFGAQYVGREVRDGHGVPLYRKTSEDSIRGGHSEGRTAHSDVRGRNRDGKRISESLSPPVIGSIPAERRTGLSPPSTSGTYRPIPSAGVKSHFARTSGTLNSGDNGTDKNSLLDTAPVAGSAEARRPISSRRSDSSRSESREQSDTASVESTSSHSGSSYSTTTATGRTLPPSIPEEDEQRLRVERPTFVRGSAQSQDSSQSTSRTNPLPVRELRADQEASVNGSSRIATSSSVASASNQRTGAEFKTVTHSSDSRPPSQTFSGRNKADGASDGAGKAFADRTAELMTSARSLLGTIWNSS